MHLEHKKKLTSFLGFFFFFSFPFFFPCLGLADGYNFTFTAVFNSSTPSGGYVHATRVNFGATNYIFWSADAPRIGNYTYVLMEVDDYSGSSMPKNFVTPTVVQAVCRAVQFTVGPSRFTFHASFEAALAAHVCCGYSDSANLPVVRFNATVSSTGQACPGSLPSNDWVLIVLYVVAGVLGAMILFILLTCFVRPLKKKVWYPPKDV